MGRRDASAGACAGIASLRRIARHIDLLARCALLLRIDRAPRRPAAHPHIELPLCVRRWLCQQTARLFKRRLRGRLRDHMLGELTRLLLAAALLLRRKCAQRLLGVRRGRGGRLGLDDHSGRLSGRRLGLNSRGGSLRRCAGLIPVEAPALLALLVARGHAALLLIARLKRLRDRIAQGRLDNSGRLGDSGLLGRSGWLDRIGLSRERGLVRETGRGAHHVAGGLVLLGQLGASGEPCGEVGVL